MSKAEPMIDNRPSLEGAKLGAKLADATEFQFVQLRKKFPKHQEPCGTCAFRRGTVPNRCLPTVMDAFKCVIEQSDFKCHESGKLCCGWMIMLRAVCDKPPGKAPWDFSLSQEQIAELDAARKS